MIAKDLAKTYTIEIPDAFQSLDGLSLQILAEDLLMLRSINPVPYEIALNIMQDHVKDVQKGKAREVIWFLEHPPVLTAGTSVKLTEVAHSFGLPIIKTNRGGQMTYHGPGQRIVYLILDLNTRGRDLRVYVKKLETWIIKALETFDIRTERRAGRVGI